MSMLEGDKEDKHSMLYPDIVGAPKEDWKSWFIERGSAHFVAYLTINTLLILLYVSLCIFVIIRLRANPIKPVRRIFLIKQSLWISLSVCLLNLTSFFFVNLGHVDGLTECLLAFPCALAGLTILCCYGLEPDASIQEPPTWRYFSYKLNFNGTRPTKENCCVEIGNKREANSNGYSGETGPVPSTNESESLIPLSRRKDFRNNNGFLDPSFAKDSKSNEFLNSSASIPPGTRSITRNQLGSFTRNLSSTRVPESGPSSLSRNVSLQRVSEQSEMVPMLTVEEHQSPVTHDVCNSLVCDIFDASEISVTSPVPLAELLRTIDVHSDCDEEIIAITKADVHHGEPTPLIKFQRPPRTMTGGSCDSTCSSYDSALPRSRKNTTTTTTSGSTTVRSMSNASDRSTQVPFEDDDRICCNSAEQQATGYVLMGRGSEYLIAPIGSAVSPSNHHNRRDTDSLLRQVRDKVRSRRTSSGDSADHSSEQDSSENCHNGCSIVRKISFPFVNPSDNPVVSRDEESDVLFTKHLGGGSSTSRRKKVKKAALPMSRSMPQIFGRKILS